jgi:hypothetical protein
MRYVLCILLLLVGCVQTNQDKESNTIRDNLTPGALLIEIWGAETFTQMGSKTTDQRFVKVKMAVQSYTNQDLIGRFQLEDSKMRRYNAYPNPEILGEFVFQVTNYTASFGSIVFEVPEDAEDLWLVTSHTKIALPDIIDIRNETSKQDEQDARFEESVARAEYYERCNTPDGC